MDEIIKVLISPPVTAIAAAITIVGGAFAFGAKAWSARRPILKSLSKVPWLAIFVLAGLLTAAGLALSAGVLYGIAFVLLVASAWITATLLISRRAAQKVQSQFVNLSKQYSELQKSFHRIVALHQVDFKRAQWKITHTIEENGDGQVVDEMTIVAVNEPVYFYSHRYGFCPGHQIKVSAVNKAGDSTLSVIELEKSDRTLEIAVMLDPPSTSKMPVRIALTCFRVGIWSQLIKSSEGEGTLRVNRPTDSFEFTLLAPNGFSFLEFRPAPNVGQWKIDTLAKTSRLTWTVSRPPLRIYNYQFSWRKDTVPA